MPFEIWVIQKVDIQEAVKQNEEARVCSRRSFSKTDDPARKASHRAGLIADVIRFLFFSTFHLAQGTRPAEAFFWTIVFLKTAFRLIIIHI